MRGTSNIRRRSPLVRQTGRGLLVGAALVVGMVASSGAWAQCRDNFNYSLVQSPPSPYVPASFGFPLGVGATLSSFTSTMNTINTAFLTSTSAFVSAPGGPQPDQQGGGAWSRVVAGTVETNTSSVGTLTAPTGLTPATGTQNCDVSTRQNYVGYQAGRDISILNAGGTGANWHFGVTAGYLQAFTKDTTPAGSFTNPFFGATFRYASWHFQREYRSSVCGDLRSIHEGKLRARCPASLGFLSQQPVGPVQQPLESAAEWARHFVHGQCPLQHAAS